MTNAQVGNDALAGSDGQTILSPTAASLSAYGELPVNYFRGIPSVNVPLFSFQEKDLPVFNINLSYNSEATRTTDIPDWVGQGWSLNAGGVITRVVNGKPDELAGGFIFTKNQLATPGNMTSASFFTNSILTGGVDSAPDDFYFNFAGQGGQLFLDQNVSGDIDIRTFPQRPIKVEFLYGSDLWKITDENGILYTFEKTETTPWSSCTSCTPTNITSSWYLTQIKSPNSGAEINITYSNQALTTYTTPLIEEKFVVAISSMWQQTPSDINLSRNASVQRRFIESISSDRYVIDFTRSARDDNTIFSGEKKLDVITIENKSSQTIKSFEFDYEYCPSFSCSGVSDKRLFLKEVTEKGADGSSLPSFKMEYNSTVIPRPTSKSVDHWGYYNGKVNTTFIPTTTYYNSAQLQYEIYIGADRTPHSSLSQAGILTKITYPTGGHSSFEYEPHTFSDLLKTLADPKDLEKRQLTTLSDANNTSGSYETSTFSISGSSSKPSAVQVNALIEYCEAGFPCATTPPQGVPAQWVRIINTATQATVYTTDSGENETIFLSNGNYRLEVNMITSDPLKLNTASGALTIYEEKTYTNRIGGGNRIKKMITHDGVDSGNDIIKTFEYEFSGTSTGAVFFQPKYMHEGVGYVSLSSTPIQLGGGLKHLGYNKVRVNHGSLAEYGYEEHTFNLPMSTSLLSDEDLDFFRFEKDSYLYGQNLKTEVFDELGSRKASTQNIFYDSSDDSSPSSLIYKELPHFSYKSVGGTLFSACSSSGCTIGTNKFFYTHSFNQRIPWVYQSEAIQKAYDGANELTTRKKFFYDDYTHLQTTKIEETNSLTSEKRSTIFEYANEVYNSTGGMLEKNMLAQPYSVLIEDGSGNDLSKSWTIWSNTISGAPSGAWLPKEQWTWEGTGTAPSTPTTSIAVKNSTIAKYDSYGNPLEIEDANGTKSKFYYGSNASPFSQVGSGINLTGVQKVFGTDNCASNCGTRPTGTDDLFTEADYDVLNRVTSITDENSKTTTFVYDDFSRLTKSINPNGGVTRNSYFYSSEPSGSYSASAPNLVETVTGTNSYETDFSISDQSEWTRVGDITFGHSYAGETTVRMGVTGSAWSYIYKNTGTENLWAKIDMYPDNTTQNPSGNHNYALSFNDGTGGSDYRCAIKYDAATDEFFAFYRTNSSASWSSDYEFSTIDAAPNAWYTIEMEKRGSLCMMWVYKKGASRSSGAYYEVNGFQEEWTPQIRIWSKDDFYYLANFEYIVNAQASISYLDGLGREIQSQARGANKVITTETLYNKRGLPEIAARPVEINPDDSPGYYSSGLLGGTGFTPGGDIPALAPVHTYYAPLLAVANDEDYAYSQTEYEDSPLARVEKSTLPGTAFKLGSGKEVTSTYSLNTGTTETFATSAVSGLVGAKSWAKNTLTKTISEDPSGNKTITYANGWGQTIASGVDMDNNSKLERSTTDLVTEFAYDERGNLVLVEDPRGLQTKYWYNTLGQLIKKELPDQDEPNSYCYDDKGRLRYHRDPNHEANVTYYYSTPQYDYHYIKYDDLDRPIETGEKDGLGSYNSACSTYANNQTYPSSYHTPKVYYSYDGTDAYTGANNLNGRLTKVKYLESLGYMGVKVWGETWYSYNNLGLVEWIVQKVPGVTGDIKITYTYDELGRQTQMGYNVTNASDDHYFWYEYDALGRLEYVYSDTDSNPTGRIKEAEYTSYSADGQVAQMKLGNGNIQTVDYTYTAQGWLDKMNAGTVSSATNGDRFALDLDYADNGNITLQKWMQSAISTSNTVQYNYTYDRANRLSFANFSGTGYSSTKFDVDPTYDDNGNISYMERYGDPNYSEMEIHIKSTSNRIEQVDDYDTQQAYTVTYDANGNMLQNRFTNGVYNERNLMTSVKSGTTTIEFGYDGDGNRVRKEVVGGIETTYVRGADGQTIAVYENGSRAFVNLLAGGQMLGTYDGSQRRYFLKDHLGTVRTTVDQSGNVDGYDDYYPFGLVMSGRSNNTSNPDDNYKFTGHERDDEAGLNLDYMMARNYDPVIGRFLQIDPFAHQFPEWSSYNYALNSPMNFTDPDGNSPVSIFAKQAAKLGLKKAAKNTIRSQLRKRLANYSSKKWAKQLSSDALAAIDIATGQSWWEYAIEVVPIAGDIYGGARLTQQGLRVWRIVEKFEALGKHSSRIASKAWRKIEVGEVTGKGSELLSGFTKKFNNIGSHLSENDLVGATKDLFGEGVKRVGGGTFDHIGEVNDAIHGLGQQLGGLRKMIDSGVFEGDALKAARSLYNRVNNRRNELRNVLQQARSAGSRF